FRRGRRIPLRGKSARQKKETAEIVEEKQITLHELLDAESVTRDDGKSKTLKRESLAGKGTTTNRRGTKTSTTFCVFLLTGNLHPLILRIQIRGTWKRQTDR